MRAASGPSTCKRASARGKPSWVLRKNCRLHSNGNMHENCDISSPIHSGTPAGTTNYTSGSAPALHTGNSGCGMLPEGSWGSTPPLQSVSGSCNCRSTLWPPARLSVCCRRPLSIPIEAPTQGRVGCSRMTEVSPSAAHLVCQGPVVEFVRADRCRPVGHRRLQPQLPPAARKARGDCGRRVAQGADCGHRVEG